MNSHIRLHAADDVVITRQQLLSGATVEGIAVRGLIPPGHKVATRAIATGAPLQPDHWLCVQRHFRWRACAHPQP